MSGDTYTNASNTGGRNWSSLPVEGGPLEWSIDADQGRIQGPLDLEFLRGQSLSLVLKENQQALLVRDGQLSAVYLDGAHHLEIGHGSRQIDPACQLIFLAMNDPLQMKWTPANPLRWGPEAHQTLIGSCALHVQGVGRFFDTFLQGRPSLEPGFIERLIDQQVRGLFEDLLAADPETGIAPSDIEVQARLTRLSPNDLSDELNACGLGCTHLAVYTSAPPIENRNDSSVPSLETVGDR